MGGVDQLAIAFGENQLIDLFLEPSERGGTGLPFLNQVFGLT
jgi:hypothetical protein